MKFGKLLQSRAEELRSTGLTEHFLRYKALKKTLKQISRKEPQSEPAAGAPHSLGVTSASAQMSCPGRCCRVCQGLHGSLSTSQSAFLLSVQASDKSERHQGGPRKNAGSSGISTGELSLNASSGLQTSQR